MFTVTTTTGTLSVAGAFFIVDDGLLVITDSNGINLAAFAAGVWQSVEVVPS